ncbi:MAG: hypothetical protein LBB20_00160 [Puniceicoccales bacterium]|nr:hypothetical protein [Puniceicoccales bacterium]
MAMFCPESALAFKCDGVRFNEHNYAIGKGDWIGPMDQDQYVNKHGLKWILEIEETDYYDDMQDRIDKLGASVKYYLLFEKKSNEINLEKTEIDKLSNLIKMSTDTSCWVNISNNANKPEEPEGRLNGRHYMKKKTWFDKGVKRIDECEDFYEIDNEKSTTLNVVFQIQYGVPYYRYSHTMSIPSHHKYQMTEKSVTNAIGFALRDDQSKVIEIYEIDGIKKYLADFLVDNKAAWDAILRDYNTQTGKVIFYNMSSLIIETILNICNNEVPNLKEITENSLNEIIKDLYEIDYLFSEWKYFMPIKVCEYFDAVLKIIYGVFDVGVLKNIFSMNGPDFDNAMIEECKCCITRELCIIIKVLNEIGKILDTETAIGPYEVPSRSTSSSTTSTTFSYSTPSSTTFSYNSYGMDYLYSKSENVGYQRNNGKSRRGRRNRRNSRRRRITRKNRKRNRRNRRNRKIRKNRRTRR